MSPLSFPRRSWAVVLLVAVLGSGCPRSGAPSSAARVGLTRTLAGDWTDSSGARYKIVRFARDQPVVSYVVGPAGEPFTIVDQSWTDAGFELTYNVPSNGWTVTITIPPTTATDRVPITWRNDKGQAGTDEMVRP